VGSKLYSRYSPFLRAKKMAFYALLYRYRYMSWILVVHVWSVLGPGLSLSRVFGGVGGVKCLALGGWRRREWWGYHEGVPTTQHREHSPITHAELGLSW
jgi:hypothetical protein